MKTWLLFFLSLSSGLLLAQPITIDEAASEVSFHFLDDDVEGTVSGFSFTGSVDLSDLSNAQFSGSVETKTLDTNNWLRSRHLRAKKFFNAKDYPTLSFESSSVEGVNEGFQVTGTLTIKGISKTVIWNFVNNGSALIGTAALNTKDFEIEIHTAHERNEAVITISMPYE